MFSIILTLVVVGFLLYIINAFVPMPAKFKHFVNIVIIFLLALWLLQALFGGSALRLGALSEPHTTTRI